MKKQLRILLSALPLLLLLSALQPAHAQSLTTTALEQRLYDLPGITFKEIPAPAGFKACYELRIRQPLDHARPDGPAIYQRVFLSHRGFDRPTVIATEGYARSVNRIYEVTELLDANQLDVEHRYFGASVPDSMDYRYLNLEQATADLHHINEVFRKIYAGKWVSTGISKGGQTTIFYRYFFPDDVDVSVPYVAPLNLAFEDTRIYDFLNTVGSQDCRDAILELQKRLLKNRKPILSHLKFYARGAGLKFTYHSLEEAFELAVLELSFSFWQWGYPCSDIPRGKSDWETDLNYMLDISGVDFFADAGVEQYASHYYQASAQMGYYAYETAPFKGLLKALPMRPNPHASFTPDKMKVPFDNAVPKKTAEWLKKNGNRFIHIYGEIDTWSATMVPKADVDALWFVLKDRSHRSARIRNFSDEQKKQMIGKLEEWLEMEIEE